MIVEWREQQQEWKGMLRDFLREDFSSKNFARRFHQNNFSLFHPPHRFHPFFQRGTLLCFLIAWEIANNIFLPISARQFTCCSGQQMPRSLNENVLHEREGRRKRKHQEEKIPFLFRFRFSAQRSSHQPTALSDFIICLFRDFNFNFCAAREFPFTTNNRKLPSSWANFSVRVFPISMFSF